MKNRIAAIDGMKGIHALAIACIYHLATVPYPYAYGIPGAGGGIKILDWIYQNGYIFVESFLLCSGYLSFFIILKKLNREFLFKIL